MAARPSVKDILAAARKGGAAKPDAEPSAAAPADEPVVEVEAVKEASAEPIEAAEAPAVAAPAPSLGRPLTLKEKLAAARAGGSTPAPTAKPAPAAPPAAEAVEDEPADAPLAPAVPAPAASLGRPMTLKEKLAAARGGGATAPAAGAPAAAKPAAAKAGPAAAKPGAARTLPPLEKMTDPKDLAEALRQAGAKKSKETTAAAATKVAEQGGATPATAKAAGKAAATKPAPKAKPVAPKPSKSAATLEPGRRDFLILPWLMIGFAALGTGTVALTTMLGRFMFPNVLAEPPSTIKVGVPTQFEPGEVNDRWKAEWGFWIVRSVVEGQDSIYALQSVCTHLGCPPNWLAGEQKFKCPCHGSGFYVSGVNFEGPAPRPLERFKIVMADDGQVLIDKSQKFQQELGQWADPDSFLAV